MDIIKKLKCKECKGKLYNGGMTKIENKFYHIGKCVNCNKEHTLELPDIKNSSYKFINVSNDSLN